jgi:leucyl aminopeptidase
MQIQLTTTQPLSSQTLVIPVQQTDELSGTLISLANRFNLEPAVLQHDFKADFKEVLPMPSKAWCWVFAGVATT